MLAVGSSKGILLWNVHERRKVSLFTEHASPVFQIHFSPDGILLASIGKDGAVRLWNGDDWASVQILGQSTCFRSYRGGLAFHPNAYILATLGQSGNIVRIWELDITSLFNCGNQSLVGESADFALT
ncbi:WD40 repeat domain-containing protein [Candidatus Entotheonella palauensis]|uniref:WD40 repeat domain-containing protein n=1 Tax=Candidatus Entotheonella palauensis TaxID=93172 RepID=UPI000B7CC3F1